MSARVQADKTGINNFEIARNRPDPLERCWRFEDWASARNLEPDREDGVIRPLLTNDHRAARGAGDAVRKTIHDRDAFTRIEVEKTWERTEKIRAKEAELERRRVELARRGRARDDLACTFAESDP